MIQVFKILVDFHLNFLGDVSRFQVLRDVVLRLSVWNKQSIQKKVNRRVQGKIKLTIFIKVSYLKEEKCVEKSLKIYPIVLIEYPKRAQAIKVVKIPKIFSFDEQGTMSPYPMIVIVVNSKYNEFKYCKSQDDSWIFAIAIQVGLIPR